MLAAEKVAEREHEVMRGRQTPEDIRRSSNTEEAAIQHMKEGQKEEEAEESSRLAERQNRLSTKYTITPPSFSLV
jgi:hypothetical protein